VADEKQTIIIKKVQGGGGHGHHGGAWKVAFADFMTAMMAFWLVMWILGQSDEVKNSVQEYFQDPGGYIEMLENRRKKPIITPDQDPGRAPITQRREDPREGVLSESDKRDQAPKEAKFNQKEATNEQILSSFQEALNRYWDSVYDFRSTADYVMFSVSAERIFPPGGVEILPSAVPTLQEIGKLFKGLNFLVYIEGHTDSEPVRGKFNSNWELSSARAARMVQYFSKEFQIPEKMMTAMGVADTKPFVLNPQNENQRALNRRIRFFLLRNTPFD
jgi:chemotaxis protein MotB